MLDSDEQLSTQAGQVLQNLQLQRGTVYAFPFHNYFNGKWIKSCGWYPDRHVRLFHRCDTTYKDQAVHEALKLDQLNVINLLCPIIHFTYSFRIGSCINTHWKQNVLYRICCDEKKDLSKIFNRKNTFLYIGKRLLNTF